MAQRPTGIFVKPPKSSAQIECEGKGGKWDANNQTCIMPPPEPVKPTTPEIIREQDTGEPTAITLPSGKTFFGSRKDLEELAASKAARDPLALPLGTVEAGTAQRAADIERAQQELQATGAPVRRELDPTLEPGEEFPVLGPLSIKIQKALVGIEVSIRNNIFGQEVEDDFFKLQPEELKTVALTAIEKNEIEKGLTKSEEFGSFIEALGLGGLSNFAAEKPSENVRSILRQIKIAKTRATNAEIKVKDGTWRQGYGEEVINGIENDIQRFESRMKLLIQDSPEFKFDSDGVNFIEDKIFEARERLFAAKINILSGAAQDPSEIQLLIALQESIQQEDFEI